MQDNHPEAIIFDLGNVLIDFDHRIAARRISKFSNQAPEEVFNLFFDSGLTALFEKGTIQPENFFSEVKKILRADIEYHEFLPIWNEIFFLSDKNRQVYSLAKSLRQKYRLALLTNINILHLEYLKSNFAVFDVFHKILASCELGVSKPDPLIYEKSLNILGVRPAQAVYFDDRAELIEAAGGLGVRSFLFSSVKQLKEDLVSCGIHTE
jgi:epoxide hydrolase-like predicted phosphatase